MNKIDFYNGNPNLPKANLSRVYTQHEIDEYMKCSNDPIYFAETYFKIVHQRRGLVQMELYEYQREAIRKYEDSGKLIMAASRQCGKTSVATVVILHAAIFNQYKNIALLANKESTAKEILERVKLAFMNLPDFLKPGVHEWNKKSVELDNGCKIFADSTQGNSIRGKAVFLLYVDECAFIQGWNEFSSSVLPTISSNISEDDGQEEEGEDSKMIFTSTPNGLNHFYYYHEDAKRPESEWGLVEVPWWEVPGRGEKWKERALADLNYDMERFAQEYEVSYIGSSGTLINGAILKTLKGERPIHKDDWGLKIFEYPEKGKTYVIPVDVSRGKGLDYHAFHVIDVTSFPYKQVATFRNNNINATDYAMIINTIGQRYNDAFLLIELNDNGLNVSDLMFFTHEYENILCTENKGRSGKTVTMNGRNTDRGLTTTSRTKSSGCALLKMLIEQKKIIIRDQDTIDELNTFSRKKLADGTYSSTLTYEAEPEKHDDTVMALVIFSWLTAQDFFKLLTDSNVLEELQEMSSEDLDILAMPVMIIDNGVDPHETGQPIEVSGSTFDSIFTKW